MSGNFDFPPASSSNNDTGSSFPPRLQELRRVLHRERERERANREAAAAERQNLQSDPSMPPLTRSAARRRRPSARHLPQVSLPQPSRDTSSPARDSEPSSAAIRDRPRATPSERYINLRRQRQQLGEDDNSLADLLEAGERLRRASSSINELIDSFPSIGSASRPGIDSPRRRLKRRKLDHEGGPQGFQGFQYGRYGQVEPGRLKMEIVSCDGGEYSDSQMALYRAENVLRNDKSVYCTKSSRCNLLLRHQGETTFCLDRIVIKAPERGFTAPVQEGMIFLSMSSDELLKGTSQYQIHYIDPSFQPPPNPPASFRDRERLTLLEGLRDPEVWEASRRWREEDREYVGSYAAMRRRELVAEAARSRSFGVSVSNIENCDPPSIASTVTAPTPPPFTVTTHSDYESSDDEGTASPAIIADRLRRESRWRPDSDDEEDELTALNLFWESRDEFRPMVGSGLSRGTRRSTPSRIEPRDPLLEVSNGSDQGVLAPHARFFIAKHKSKITVKFDPPASGKFLLLKLWSPSHGGNIDIQTIAAYGYAGPRYFPSAVPR